MAKFTDKSIQALKPRAKRYEVLEGGGFTVRVYPTGRKVFYYVFKEHGRNQRVRIGEYPSWKLAAARREYRRLLDRRELGQDLRASDGVLTVGDLIDFFVKEWSIPHRKSTKEDQRILERSIRPRWGHRPATEITRRDVISLLEDGLKSGPRASKTLLEMVRRMYNFAIERDRIQYSPCIGVKPLVAMKSKDRALTAGEIKVFWNSLDSTDMCASMKSVLRTILLTGQRPGEVINMRASEIEGDWWTIPAERAKNGRENRVWLTDTVQGLISSAGELAFPSPRPGEGASESILCTRATARALRRNLLGKKLKNKKVPPTMPMAAFTPHDLRRTAATHMAQLGVPEFVVGQVLNHKEQTITSVYNRYQYDKEKKAALVRWEKRLIEIVMSDE